ncbi:MAG: GNAT family N-acetyltransferase [Bacteroidota bacterium]
MDITIEVANEQALAWLLHREVALGPDKIRRKIKDGEILLSSSEEGPMGFLRFGYFWDEIPFMNMLIIEEHMRGKGTGTKLVWYWEEEMARRGYEMVMTSTLANENAQHFYRKLGYRDSGALLLPGEPLEILFVKGLSLG